MPPLEMARRGRGRRRSAKLVALSCALSASPVITLRPAVARKTGGLAALPFAEVCLAKESLQTTTEAKPEASRIHAAAYYRKGWSVYERKDSSHYCSASNRECQSLQDHYMVEILMQPPFPRPKERGQANGMPQWSVEDAEARLLYQEAVIQVQQAAKNTIKDLSDPRLRLVDKSRLERHALIRPPVVALDSRTAMEVDWQSSLQGNLLLRIVGLHDCMPGNGTDLLDAEGLVSKVFEILEAPAARAQDASVQLSALGLSSLNFPYDQQGGGDTVDLVADRMLRGGYFSISERKTALGRLQGQPPEAVSAPWTKLFKTPGMNMKVLAMGNIAESDFATIRKSLWDRMTPYPEESSDAMDSEKWQISTPIAEFPHPVYLNVPWNDDRQSGVDSLRSAVGVVIPMAEDSSAEAVGAALPGFTARDRRLLEIVTGLLDRNDELQGRLSCFARESWRVHDYEHPAGRSLDAVPGLICTLDRNHPYKRKTALEQEHVLHKEILSIGCALNSEAVAKDAKFMYEAMLEVGEPGQTLSKRLFQLSFSDLNVRADVFNWTFAEHRDPNEAPKTTDISGPELQAAWLKAWGFVGADQQAQTETPGKAWVAGSARRMLNVRFTRKGADGLDHGTPDIDPLAPSPAEEDKTETDRKQCFESLRVGYNSMLQSEREPLLIFNPINAKALTSEYREYLLNQVKGSYLARTSEGAGMPSLVRVAPAAVLEPPQPPPEDAAPDLRQPGEHPGHTVSVVPGQTPRPARVGQGPAQAQPAATFADLPGRVPLPAFFLLVSGCLAQTFALVVWCVERQPDQWASTKVHAFFLSPGLDRTGLTQIRAASTGCFLATMLALKVCIDQEAAPLLWVRMTMWTAGITSAAAMVFAHRLLYILGPPPEDPPAEAPSNANPT